MRFFFIGHVNVISDWINELHVIVVYSKMCDQMIKKMWVKKADCLLLRCLAQLRSHSMINSNKMTTLACYSRLYTVVLLFRALCSRFEICSCRKNTGSFRQFTEIVMVFPWAFFSHSFHFYQCVKMSICCIYVFRCKHSTCTLIISKLFQLI